MDMHPSEVPPAYLREYIIAHYEKTSSQNQPSMPEEQWEDMHELISKHVKPVTEFEPMPLGPDPPKRKKQSISRKTRTVETTNERDNTSDKFFCFVCHDSVASKKNFLCL
jgi:hypothetical protein